jgi:hypothetical protein
MVIEYSKSDIEGMKQATVSEIAGLKDYLSLLTEVLEDAERDIVDTRVKARIFISIGQAENHGYLMERIQETSQRADIVKKCMDECRSNISYKEERLRYYESLLVRA